MNPDDQIVGGTVLRIPAIQSPNFLHNVSGWFIGIDGSAEFNNLTIRGTFNGTDYVINSSGLFFYSGTPATGNLVTSLTNAAGTDAFGNSYPAGFGIFDSSGVLIGNWSTTGIHINNDPGSGTLRILSSTNPDFTPVMYWLSNLAPAFTAPAEQYVQNGLITAGMDSLALVSPNSGPATDAGQSLTAIFLTQGAATNGATGQLQFTSFGSPDDTHAALIWAATYTAIYKGVAFQPASNTAEVWHDITGGVGYQNGWSDNGGGFTVGRYKLAVDANRVWLDGTIKPGTFTNGTKIFTLPAGYQPAASCRFVMQTDAAGTSMFELNIDTSGNVEVVTVTGSTPGFVSLTGLSFPLD